MIGKVALLALMLGIIWTISANEATPQIPIIFKGVVKDGSDGFFEVPNFIRISQSPYVVRPGEWALINVTTLYNSKRDVTLTFLNVKVDALEVKRGTKQSVITLFNTTTETKDNKTTNFRVNETNISVIVGDWETVPLEIFRGRTVTGTTIKGLMPSTTTEYRAKLRPVNTLSRDMEYSIVANATFEEQQVFADFDPLLTDNLVAYYTMDDEQLDGTVVVDVSDFSNNGTLENSPTTGVPGLINEAIQFDGIDDCVSTNNMSAFIPSEASHTLMVWVNITAVLTDDIFIGFNGRSELRYLNNRVTYRIFHPSTGDVRAEFVYLSPQNNHSFQHYVGTYENSTTTITLYVNGNSKDTDTGNWEKDSDLWGIGGNGPCESRWTPAIFDESAYWNRSLSSTEVEDLHNLGAGLAHPFTTDTCTYASGDFVIDCSDACVFSIDPIVSGDWHTQGTGTIHINSDFNVDGDWIREATCTVVLLAGNRIILKD